MEYKQLKTEDDQMDTVYKKFEDGGIWIAQFNEKVQEDEVGSVLLTKKQVEKLSDGVIQRAEKFSKLEHAWYNGSDEDVKYLLEDLFDQGGQEND